MHSISWQTELSNAISDVATLLSATRNLASDIDGLDHSQLDFPLRVPQPYVSRIEPATPNDPLLRQVLPLLAENQPSPGYITDPLDEASSNIQPGIIHKYQGRVLFILTGACAINCRYCFRRHFPYNENQNSMAQWQEALEYVRRDSSITEVIYSGGDPLLNSDRKLLDLTRAIANIPHVKRLRVHTRLPIVIPQRITDELFDWLTGTRLKPVMVIHANHPAELDNQVAAALARLHEHGVTLLNQSVLLKGVNDQADTLIALSERLFSLNVQPYYLHVLDKVQGAAHFDLTRHAAQRLAGEMAAQLPGYLTPRLVMEIAGKPAKTALLPLL